MLEIELGDKTPLYSRMKIFKNDYLSKNDFIAIYDKLYDKELNPFYSTKIGKIKASVLITIISTLSQNPDREYLALNEISSVVINKEYCSKSKFSLILSEFLQAGLFLEKRVYAIDKKRKLVLISFPENIMILESAIQRYINKLNDQLNLPKTAFNTPKNNSAAIKDSVCIYPSSKRYTKDKNVIVIKEDKDISLLNILSSICPITKTTIQEGTFSFNVSSTGTGKTTKVVHEETKINYKSTTWSDSDSVMIFKDLKIYCAVISLVYHAHLSRFKEYHHKQTLPQNLTHLHLEDILNLTVGNKNSSFGGTQREECRKSLQRIRKTNVELRPNSTVDLSKITSSSNNESLSKAKTETTLRPFKELSRVDFMDNGGEWGESTMDFIIQLPDVLFEKMFTSNFHWLFPPSFLTVDELLFALYLYLRNNWTKGQTKKTFLIEDFYYQHEASVNDFSEFIARLNYLLTKLATKPKKPPIKRAFFSVVKTQYKKIYKLALFGYNCTIDINEQTIDTTLNEELFYEALEISSATRKSPTWSNDLVKLTYSDLLSKKKLSVYENAVLEEMSQAGRSMLPKTNLSIKNRLPKMLPCVNKDLGFIELKLGKSEKSFFITLVSSDEHKQNVCDTISNMLAAPINEITMYINKLIPTIPCIYQSKRIKESDFKIVYEQYLKSISAKDDIDKQIGFFNLAAENPSAFHFMMSLIPS